jgi:hypothetical protein
MSPNPPSCDLRHPIPLSSSSGAIPTNSSAFEFTDKASFFLSTPVCPGVASVVCTIGNVHFLGAAEKQTFLLFHTNVPEQQQWRHPDEFKRF